MSNSVPDDIRQDLEKATALHERAASDFEKCQQFNRLMSDLLGRLEDAGLNRLADKVMGILLDCNPKAGSQCDKALRIGDKMKKL